MLFHRQPAVVRQHLSLPPPQGVCTRARKHPQAPKVCKATAAADEQLNPHIEVLLVGMQQRHAVPVVQRQQQQLLHRPPHQGNNEQQSDTLQQPAMMPPAMLQTWPQHLTHKSNNVLAPGAELLQAQHGHQLQGRQQTLLPHPLCTLEPRVLTNRIKNCQSWQQAAVLFAQQAPCMNHINLSALLSRLAHLPGAVASRPVNWRAFIHQVLMACEPQLQHCSSRQLSNMAWALAVLNCNASLQDPSSSFATAWQQHVIDKLHTSSCRDIANILWALATANRCNARRSTGNIWQHQPDIVGLNHHHHQQQQQRQQGQQLPVLSQRFCQELLSAVHRELPNSCSQDVSNTLWALAALQLQPSTELHEFLLSRAQLHAAQLKTQEVANILWALSQLKLAPSSSWLQDVLLRQVANKAQWLGAPAQHLVMCLTACSHLAVMPPTKWIGQCLMQLQQILLRPLLPTDSAASIAADRGSTGSSLRRCSGNNSGSHKSSFVSRRSTQDMANTLWALGSLRIRPNAVWMADFVAASATVLAESQPQEICNTIWALAKLQVVPSQAWLLAFDQATLSCMDQFTAQGLADLLAAQVYLKLSPSAAWTEAWLVAVQRAWGSADSSAVCKILWAAANVRVPVGRAWLREALKLSYASVQHDLQTKRLPVQDFLRLMWAVGHLRRGGQLYQSLSDTLALHCCQAAAGMTWRQLAKGAEAMARLQPLPQPHLIHYYCEVASSRLKYMPELQAMSVQKQLQRLGAPVPSTPPGAVQQVPAAGSEARTEDQQAGACSKQTVAALVATALV